MIAHPFEIKPSTGTTTPDELMITWGSTPNLSVASIYLPAVAAVDILSLADKMYVKHRLALADAHTIQCSAGDVTFVPIPPGQGQGRFSGLLSLALPATVSVGDVFTVAVRQLTIVSATVEPPPPPPPQPQIIESATRAARQKATKTLHLKQPQIIESAARATGTIAEPKTFSWRQVSGAFQYTVTVTPGSELLYPQERLLAWLKWRIGVTPPLNRWLPVLQRYLTQTEDLVWTLGRDPSTIPPSQVGNVPGKAPQPPCPPGPPVPPFPLSEEREYTGKVIAIEYDRFGDFCGFVILTETGHEHQFRGCEHAIEELVHEAWVERTVVSVLVSERDRELPVNLILRRHH